MCRGTRRLTSSRSPLPCSEAHLAVLLPPVLLPAYLSPQMRTMLQTGKVTFEHVAGKVAQYPGGKAYTLRLKPAVGATGVGGAAADNPNDADDVDDHPDSDEIQTWRLSGAVLDFSELGGFVVDGDMFRQVRGAVGGGGDGAGVLMRVVVVVVVKLWKVRPCSAPFAALPP